ncbi:MAG: hypothetical protein ACO1OC_12775 [Tuberibacillus sp.]
MDLVKERVARGRTQLGTVNTAYRVTFVSEKTGSGAEVNNDGLYSPLVTGRVLDVHEKIVTLNSYVEIRDNNGMLFRLGPNSEFALEPTFSGIIPVYWGEVYVTPQNGLNIYAQQKYRTSCYFSPQALYMENLDKNLDGFYALSEDVIIYEYDEQGKRFPIVVVPEGSRAVLEYREDKPMRERYVVSEVSEITDEQYDRITSKFLNPKAWR